MIEIIKTLLADEMNEDTFAEIENSNEIKGLRSFNITTAPHTHTCELTSSTITYTKQLILSSKLTANITVVKTAVYIDDDCGRTDEKPHVGMCMMAKFTGESGALWTTTITVSILDSVSNTVTTATKTKAIAHKFIVETELFTTLTKHENGKLSTRCG